MCQPFTKSFRSSLFCYSSFLCDVFWYFGKVVCFFSCSTHRWNVLLANVEVTVKRLAETRWSAHTAIKPLNQCLNAFRRLLLPLRNFVTLQKLSTLEEQLKLCWLQCGIFHFCTFYIHRMVALKKSNTPKNTWKLLKQVSKSASSKWEV